AFVAPAPVLTARLALSLLAWSGWQRCDTPDRVLTPLEPDQLRAEYDHVSATLRDRAVKAPGPLVAMVAAALRSPRQALGVILPSEEFQSSRPSILLWGYMEVLGAGLTGTPEQEAANPTFSTYEPHLDDGSRDKLQVVFAPRMTRGGSSFGVSRAVVRPIEASEQEDSYAALARSFVARYSAG